VVMPFTDITTSASVLFPIAFKRPVIATPLGNIPDIIIHGQTGWLANSPYEILDCIKEVRHDPEKARSIGERAYDFVGRMASIDKVANAYVRAYKRATELGAACQGRH